ncbi:hypothetical protein [Hymenobacter volaticus]|uniref:Uncharacterized protein n=1 Tax=Hymenobacter volaticus TaxID=2932254 RepID=A0ABY4GI35_9BACT|nr:hypothetical protein [Hymenobacter volaticus]UOQ69834.1 hypothetical protein MUN86_30090 [Hymenobacter volaticus]
MTDLASLQALLASPLQINYQVQGNEQGAATLTIEPDEQRVLGPAGSQVVYTFEKGKFVSMEILVAAG